MKNRILIIFWAYYNLIREWLNMLDPIKRRIFNKRLEICKTCSFKNSFLNTCSICKCPIKAKTRGDYDIDKNGKSISGCPQKIW